MPIEVAKSAGFCFGVKRAVEKTYELSENAEKRIVTYGPIIHNEQVIEDLKKHSVNVISDLKDADENSLVIIRAHGVGKSVYEYFKENNIEYVDLTCPFVKKIHKIVEENYNDGYSIVVIGKKNHPEVIGINGWCDESAIILYEEAAADELLNKIKEKEKICIVAQTTINKQKFYNYVKFIKNTCKIMEIVVQ